MTRGPVWIHHYSDGVVKVVLDRPEKANALSATMLEALIAAMRAQAERYGVRRERGVVERVERGRIVPAEVDHLLERLARHDARAAL